MAIIIIIILQVIHQIIIIVTVTTTTTIIIIIVMNKMISMIVSNYTKNGQTHTYFSTQNTIKNNLYTRHVQNKR